MCGAQYQYRSAASHFERQHLQLFVHVAIRNVFVAASAGVKSCFVRALASRLWLVSYRPLARMPPPQPPFYFAHRYAAWDNDMFKTRHARSGLGFEQKARSSHVGCASSKGIGRLQGGGLHHHRRATEVARPKRYVHQTGAASPAATPTTTEAGQFVAPAQRRRRAPAHHNMPRPEGVLSMKARSLFARKHRRFVAISQGGLSTFKLQKPEDIAVLETRKDLPFDYVEGVRLDGSRFVVKRRKPWRSDVVFYCATAPAARAWAEALRSRLDAFRNKARVQFPPLNESLGPNLSPRPELPPYPPPSPARLKAGQVDVAG